MTNSYTVDRDNAVTALKSNGGEIRRVRADVRKSLAGNRFGGRQIKLFSVTSNNNKSVSSIIAAANAKLADTGIKLELERFAGTITMDIMRNNRDMNVLVVEA